MSYGVLVSDLLMEDAVLRRMRGEIGDKFRIGLDVNSEVTGNVV